MEATSHLATQHSKYDEVYINTLEFLSYEATKRTHSTTIQAHYTLEGTMLFNEKEAKVLFDTETIGANLMSAGFLTIDGIPWPEMKEHIKILMAIKGSRSGSHKQCTVYLAVGKLWMKGNKMLVGTLAKYDAFIGMLFLKQQGAMVKCCGLAIDFPNIRIKINLVQSSVRQVILAAGNR